MTYMLRLPYRLVFSLITLLPLGTLTAQPDPTALLRMADQYFERENYNACVTECLRFLHFAPDHPLAYYAYYTAGIAESRLGNGEGGIRWLRRAASQAPNRATQQRIKYKLALILLSQYQLDLAKLELLQLALTNHDTLFVTNANILLGVVHLYQNDWEQARKAFHRASRLHPESMPFQEKMQIVDLQLQRLSRKPHIRSPRTAKWISTFLPGGGQIYAGRTWNGLNALALNAGTTYLVQRAVARRSVRDAILLITGLWWRYYQGNRYRAEDAAIAANSAYREEILSEVYLLMQDASTHLPTENYNVSWQEKED